MVRTTENSLDLSLVLLTPHTRQHPCRTWCERGFDTQFLDYFGRKISTQMSDYYHDGCPNSVCNVCEVRAVCDANDIESACDERDDHVQDGHRDESDATAAYHSRPHLVRRR